MKKPVIFPLFLLFILPACGEFEKGQARATVIDLKKIVAGIESYREKNGTLPKVQ